MEMNIIFIVVMAVALIVGYIAGFYKDKANAALYAAEDKLSILAGWAEKFVAGAEEFLDAKTGEEKMQSVIEHLSEIADEAGIGVTKDQLEAIAQTAYNAMKYGRMAAKEPMFYRIGSRAAAHPGAGGVIVINNTYGETPTDDEADGAGDEAEGDISEGVESSEE